MRRLALMLLLILSLTAWAHQALPPGQPPASPDRTAQALHTLFPVALKAGVTLETKKLLSWHPDVLPYLRQWLDAICATMVTSTDTEGLRGVLITTLYAIDMPPTMHNILEEFIPVLVALIPFALEAAEAVPQVETVVVVVTEVCEWMRHATFVKPVLPQA